MSRSLLWSFWAPTASLPPPATVKAVPTLARDSSVDANNVYVRLGAPREEKGCWLSDPKDSTARSELEHRLARSDSAKLALGGVSVYVEVRPDDFDLAKVLA